MDGWCIRWGGGTCRRLLAKGLSTPDNRLMEFGGDQTSASAVSLPRAVSRDVKFMSIAFLLTFVAYDGVQQYVITFFNGAGRSNVGFVSLILVYASSAVASPLAAAAVSRFGAKPAMLASLPFYSLFILSLGTKSTAIIWAASIALGIAGGGLWNGQNTYLVRAAHEDALGTNAGYFSVLKAVGSGAGVVVVGFAVVRTSYVATFVAAALLPVLACLCVARMSDIRAEHRHNRLRHALSALRSVTAWRLSALWFCTSLVFGLVLSAIPVVIQGTLGLAFVGVLTSCFYIVPILTSYATGNQSDIRGRRALLLGACAAGTVGLIALNLPYTAVTVVGGVLLLTVCNAMLTPITTALVGDVATPVNLESLVSLFRMMQCIGTVAGLVMAGIVHGSTIFAVSLVGLAICFAVSLPVLRRDLPDIRRGIAAEIG